MNEKNEIAILPAAETALQVFTAPNGLDPYLQKIREELDLFMPDVSTKKGRDAIASMAYKVAKSKTALDDVGKALVAELKDVPKKIDAERKRMRDVLDGWKDEVRKPLTDYENAEAARIQKHHEWLESLNAFGMCIYSLGQDELNARIAQLDAIEVGPDAQEYEADGHRAKQKTLGDLKEALAARIRYDDEQAELARLRNEAAEREQRDREEQIARDAAARAQREADARAQADRDAAARRELELQQAAERAERERADAQQREQQARADAERRAAEAVAAEQRRVADQTEAEAKEARRREADKAHRQRVNRAALDVMVDGGVPEAEAKKVIQLIAKGMVPAMSIHY